MTYEEELSRLVAQGIGPDADLEACAIAHRHGKTEADVWSDIEQQYGGILLLNDVDRFIRRFCALPDEHSFTAVALWTAHTHMVEHFHTTPRLMMSSPEAASGKTRVLEVLDLLVPESMMSLSASPAAIFRTLADRQITLLFDEVDAIWSKKGKDDNHEDLRALLNAGYKRGASIPRCVGPKHEVVPFKVYCAVALAGLGDLPDTIMSRAVIIRMRRRAPDEVIEPFRSRQHEPEGHHIRDRLADWSAVVGSQAGEAWPELPDGIVDRPAEVWEPLIAVADVAGGAWPAKARAACVELNKVSQDRRASLGVRLLSDLRILFGDKDAMHTETILEKLVAGDGLDDDAPWAELRGKPLAVRGLASMLKPYGVHSVKVTVNGRSLQGYRREHLWDAWVRYLSPLPAQVELPELPEPIAQPCGFPAAGAVPDGFRDILDVELPESITAPEVPKVPEVPDARVTTSASAYREASNGE